jgi:hypothetical protein
MKDNPPAVTVKQFREYLATLPDELVVRVMEEKSANWNTWTTFRNLELPTTEKPYTDDIDVCNGYLDLGKR